MRLNKQSGIGDVNVSSHAVTAIGVILLAVFVPPVPRVLAQTSGLDQAITEADTSDKPNTGWEVRVRTVDRDGRTISKPRIGVQIGHGNDSVWQDASQDDDTIVMLPNRAPAYCYLHARAEGFAPMRAFWRGRVDPLPAEFTFVIPETITVGGVPACATSNVAVWSLPVAILRSGSVEATA